MNDTTLVENAAETPSVEPSPPRRGSALLVAALPLTYVGVTLFGFWWMGISVTSLVAGAEDSSNLIQRMVPPTFPAPGVLAGLILETLLIAVAGTGLAVIASVPLAIVSARSSSGSKVSRSLARGVVVLTRAIPSLIFAILFVRAFGLGPLAGGLAIAVHSVGMIAKLLTDAIEELDSEPTDALRAAGASSFQTNVASVLTRIAPTIIGTALYRLDINIRASAILGIVGAGGIGVALQTALGSLNYRRAAGIILVIIVLIFILESISTTARRTLSAHSTGETITDLFASSTALHNPGWDGSRVRRSTIALLVVAVFGYSLYALDANFDRIREAGPRLVDIFSGMWPPLFSSEIYIGVFESLLMALSATTVGVVFGLGLALLGANALVRSRVLSLASRTVAVVLRGIPDIVYAIVFVAALGLGPFAGFLALAISCTALAAKFFTDSLESLDPSPRLALEALGASRWQVFVSAIWPQFVPSLVANSLFTSDLAMRESTVLGIVGAGGIGFLMYESISGLDYNVTAAILISLVVVVTALESVARAARRLVL